MAANGRSKRARAMLSSRTSVGSRGLLIARHTAMIAAASSRIDQTSRLRSVEPRRALTPVECSSTATAAIGSKRVGIEQIKRRCQRPRRQMRLGDLLESLSGSQAGRSRSTSDQEARRPPERRTASPEAVPLHEMWLASSCIASNTWAHTPSGSALTQTTVSSGSATPLKTATTPATCVSQSWHASVFATLDRTV